MNRIKRKFKTGAASFYIVAFSTLILLIVATSFAAIIISEIGRTSDDDLSQSAYDSAMAGVEDAELVISSYQNCLAQGNNPTDTCQKIMRWIDNPDCYTVGRVLGRIGEDEENEVQIEENNSNNMRQAYTCVKIDTNLKDYVATLSSSRQMRVIALRFDNLKSEQIKRIKLSWYSDMDAEEGANYRFTNYSGNKILFPDSSRQESTPPVISIGLVQTAETFNLDDFEASRGNRTNRGLIYLVPSDGIKSEASNTFTNARWNNAKQYNEIGADAFVKSNSNTKTNLPYAVNCNKNDNAGNEYACSAMISLPDPVGGARNDDTFRVAVSLPYGKPTTTFSLEFFCDNLCTEDVTKNDVGESFSSRTDQARMKNVQISVDSAGRANDLYRRIETRLEPASNGGNLMVFGPLELMNNSEEGNDGNEKSLEKNISTKCEYNFDPRCWF